MAALKNEKPIKQSRLVENNMLISENSVLIFEGCYSFEVKHLIKNKTSKPKSNNQGELREKMTIK